MTIARFIVNTCDQLRERVVLQLHQLLAIGKYFDISSYCLFCGNSDKNYGKNDGYELICVQTLDFHISSRKFKAHR